MATAFASPTTRPPEEKGGGGEGQGRSWVDIAAEREEDVDPLILGDGEEQFLLSREDRKK